MQDNSFPGLDPELIKQALSGMLIPPQAAHLMKPQAAPSVREIFGGADVTAAYRYLNAARQSASIPLGWPEFEVVLSPRSGAAIGADHPTAIIISAILMSTEEEPYGRVPRTYREVRDGIWLADPQLAFVWDAPSGKLQAVFQPDHLTEIKAIHESLRTLTPRSSGDLDLATANLLLGTLRSTQANCMTGADRHETHDMLTDARELAGVSAEGVQDVTSHVRRVVWNSLLATSPAFVVARAVVTLCAIEHDDPPTVHFHAVLVTHLEDKDESLIPGLAIEAAIKSRVKGTEGIPTALTSSVVTDHDEAFAIYHDSEAWSRLSTGDWILSPMAYARVEEYNELTATTLPWEK